MSSILSNNQQFRLNRISEIRDYFVPEIKERELTSKRLSKYIASFDYFHTFLIVLSATGGGISIALFTTITVAPVGTACASFSFAFPITTGIVKDY